MSNSLQQFKQPCEKGFTKFRHGIGIRPRNVSSGAWLLLIDLLDQQAGKYIPTQEGLARRHSVARKTVIQWCSELQKANYLKIVQTGANEYTWIVFERPCGDEQQ